MPVVSASPPPWAGSVPTGLAAVVPPAPRGVVHALDLAAGAEALAAAGRSTRVVVRAERRGCGTARPATSPAPPPCCGPRTPSPSRTRPTWRSPDGSGCDRTT
ncbi:hypothetical protein GCM10025868_31580 [Angustibacter aerolatus]|uniref:Uncharacterized protein n=1 Tax=Angustibacter aerolatus TaxID=1162965 RepID=A0ABQ6JI55_9ACTN|nr:hypothetical protein GCM10025868_31580 [Angustibacter aerolatus]